jgi:dinuclear metal center YbgI/SA1388 family protein
MTIAEITQALERWAPAHLAEGYDNVGLLVGDPTETLTAALLTLDITDEVLAEAQARGCGLIIAHHPIWFGKRTRLTPADYAGRTMLRAARLGIGLYAIHTNLDNIQTGVNAEIARRLGLQAPKILAPGPQTDPEGQPAGAGMIGSLPQALTLPAFLARVKAAFQTGGIRYAAPDLPPDEAHIRRVAVCGGAGSFLTQAARTAGADALVTSDITYHKFFDADGQLVLLDIGHFESEQFTPQLLADFLRNIFPNFAFLISEVNTNPVRYYC